MTQQPTSPLKGCRILLVEDDSDTRQMIKFVLEQNGAAVAAADSVPNALDHFKSQNPDVIVADIAMAGLNGFALITEIRKMDGERKGHTPAIAVTAFSTPRDRDLAAEAGFDRYMTKPFDPRELIEVVGELARTA